MRELYNFNNSEAAEKYKSHLMKIRNHTVLTARSFNDTRGSIRYTETSELTQKGVHHLKQFLFTP